MAFLLGPLISALAGPAISGIASLINRKKAPPRPVSQTQIRKILAKGEQARAFAANKGALGSGGALSAAQMRKLFSSLGRPKARRARVAAPRSRGGALSVMNKWPLLERTARYNIGGRLAPVEFTRHAAVPAQLLEAFNKVNQIRRARGGTLSVMNKWPLLERTARLAIGGAIGSHLVRAHTSHSKYGAREFVPAHMARNPQPHLVRAHASRSRYGVPEIVAMHTAAGARLRQPGLSASMRGGAVSHYVRPHMAVSDRGTPYAVRGHTARNAGAVVPFKVAPHVRMTSRGPVRVRSHVKGSGLIGYGLLGYTRY